MGGQFDVGGIGGGDVAPLRAAGGDAVLIGAYMTVCSQEGLSRPEIQAAADLRGKTLGVTRLGSSSHYATVAMLASGSLGSDEATLVQTGGRRLAGLLQLLAADHPGVRTLGPHTLYDNSPVDEVLAAPAR